MILLVLIGIIWVRFLNRKHYFYFFSTGEYLKDLDGTIIPQDPLLMHKIPIPIVEKGACGGIWQNLENTWDFRVAQFNRDCSSSYPSYFLQPFSKLTSEVLIDKCIS